jgi:hypothetical protein
VRAEIGTLRTDMTAGLGAARAETETLRTEMTAGFGSLRTEMAALRTDMKDALREALEKREVSQRTLNTWMITTVIASIGMAFTVARFFSGS